MAVGSIVPSASTRLVQFRVSRPGEGHGELVATGPQHIYIFILTYYNYNYISYQYLYTYYVLCILL